MILNLIVLSKLFLKTLAIYRILSYYVIGDFEDQRQNFDHKIEKYFINDKTEEIMLIK